MSAGWQVFLSGLALGVTIAAPPGPVNATSANQVTRSWMSGWLVLAGATTADGIFFLLTYYGLTALISSEKLKETLFLLGGALMVVLAMLTLRGARNPLSASKGRRGGYPYFLGMAIGLSNPFQIAWWVTVGVGMISTFGPGIFLGFFSGIVAWTLGFATLLRASVARFKRAYEAITYVSGFLLLGFGVWFLYSAISGLL